MHIFLGGAFPKRHRANCGVIAVIRKVPILGRHKLVSEPGFDPGTCGLWAHHAKVLSIPAGPLCL
jgi:hypothetical protein